MKRKTLIIGSSPDSDYLPGVSSDIRSWEQFLLSPAGGGWRASEITVLREPTKQQALDASAWMSDADYGMIVFIGHGYIEDDEMGFSVTFLNLDDNQIISERELNPRTPWFLLIMDCCRKYVALEESLKMIKDAANASILSVDSVRSRYDMAIRKAEKGWVRMYAADLGQEAADTGSFSDTLIRASIKWSRHSRGILDSRDAFALVKERFERTNPQQTPIHHAGRRHNYFPIAVGGRL